MALITVDLHKCPHCQAVVDARLLGICSGLGAPRRTCRWCGNSFDLDRREWPEMTTSGRLRYWGWSLGYILLGGLVGGGSMQSGIKLIQQGWRQGWIPGLDITKPTFLIGFVEWVVIIGLVQTLRIRSSVSRFARRHDAAEQQPYLPPLVLQVGWQAPVLFLLVAPLFVGWLVAICRWWLLG